MTVAAKLIVVATLVVGAAASPALGCQKHGKPLFEDDFKNADPGWGQPDNVAAFTADGLVLAPPPDGSAWRSNGNAKMAHGDWCIDVVSPRSLPVPADENAIGAVGVWFWGKDLQNFYTATITLDGKASVDRLNQGIWQVVMPPASAASVKTDPGATNQIEIVTSGDSAAFYVNDAHIATVTGRPPADGGAAGVYGESGPQGTIWLFPRVALY